MNKDTYTLTQLTKLTEDHLKQQILQLLKNQNLYDHRGNHILDVFNTNHFPHP